MSKLTAEIPSRSGYLKTEVSKLSSLTGAERILRLACFKTELEPSHYRFKTVST